MEEMKYFAIKDHADSDFDAIRICAKKLYDEGFVTSKFADNCIEREKSFPTGLPTIVPVAMPHSEASGVIKNAICLLILDEPITFRRMDDETENIDAKMVFNLAITDPSGHMYVLRNLMALFGDTKKMEDLYQMDLKEIPKKLAAYIDQSNEV